MRSTPPTTLTRGFTGEEAETISRWWNGLRAAQRRSLRRPLEERPAWPVVVGRLRLRKEDREEPDGCYASGEEVPS